METMKKQTILTFAVAVALAGANFAQDKTYKPNDEGFIANWLCVLPITLDSETGAAALDVEHIKGQGKIQPKAGEKIKIGSETFTWEAQEADETGLLNFETINGADNAAAYAVCYVIVENDWKGKAKTGSDDQAVLWINGKEVIRNETPRGTDIDQDEAEVTLTKGSNTIVFKIIEEGGDWSGRLRFTDGNDNPNTKIKISLTPPAPK